MSRRSPVLLAGALLGSSLILCQGCRPGDSGSDPLDTPEPAPVAMHGIPSASALPPAVPGAGGHYSVLNVTGPQKAHVVSNVALPFTSMPLMLQQIGADNTVYVDGRDGVGAVRDGKLLWAYKVDAPEFFGLSDDGNLWFTKSGTGQYFVLNRDGQGGLMPRGLRRPAESMEPDRTGCSGNGRWVRGGAIKGDIGLEYECTQPQALTGPDGLIYVGTDAPDLRAYRPDKTLVWKMQVPCAAEKMIVGPNSRVFFSCTDNSMHYVDHGVMKWSVPGDGEITGPDPMPNNSDLLGVVDGQGTLYFADRPASGTGTHLHALNANGKMLWTITTALFTPNGMQFDRNGRLYMAGERGMAQHLVALGD